MGWPFEQLGAAGQPMCLRLATVSSCIGGREAGNESLFLSRGRFTVCGSPPSRLTVVGTMGELHLDSSIGELQRAGELL